MDVRARSLSKDFPRGRGGRVFTAVQPTDLDIGAGELVVITGRSGSGKSTLLAMLAGILSPTAGTVEVDGTDLHSLGEEALARFRNGSIGLVPQGHAALRSLTVLENVLLPSVLYPGRGPGGRGAEELLDAVGMAQLKDARPNELSGGELRRMAIARALLMDPGVVLADEPTAGLDAASAATALELLRGAADSGAAVLVVTHDREAEGAADRILTMDGGRLGEPEPQGAGAPPAWRSASTLSSVSGSAMEVDLWTDNSTACGAGWCRSAWRRRSRPTTGRSWPPWWRPAAGRSERCPSGGGCATAPCGSTNGTSTRPSP